MDDKDSIKVLKAFGLLMIFLLGMASGSQYADNNWKNDLIKASNHSGKPNFLAFTFHEKTIYFNIEQMTNNNYKQYLPNNTLPNSYYK